MPTVDRRGGVIDASNPNPSGGPNPGLAIKAPVRAATIGQDITLSGLQTLDTVGLCSGDRVLVKDQTNAAQNGIYIAGSGTWLLAPDWLGPSNAIAAGVPGLLLTQGLLIEVARGQVNAGAIFELASPSGKILPGTTALVFQSAATPMNMQAVFDGGGSALAPYSSTGRLWQWEVPARFTLIRWTLLANVVGSIAVDIWRGTPAQVPLSSANSITAGVPPSITGAQWAQSATPAAWQANLTAGGFNAGDILAASILSAFAVQEVTLSLWGTRP